MISPSLLSMDFSNLKFFIENINSSKADFLHIDVMDGIFTSNISFGPVIIKTIKKYSIKPIDIHLMIVNIENCINKFIDLKPYYLSIHYESSNNLYNIIMKIKKAGIKVGLVINPQTPVFLLKDIICDIDLLTLMSVNPGFSGQEFITQTYIKLEEAVSLIKINNTNTIIQIDGGVNLNNYSYIFKKGADILVSGSCIFSSSNPKLVIDKMKTYY